MPGWDEYRLYRYLGSFGLQGIATMGHKTPNAGQKVRIVDGLQDIARRRGCRSCFPKDSCRMGKLYMFERAAAMERGPRDAGHRVGDVNLPQNAAGFKCLVTNASDRIRNLHMLQGTATLKHRVRNGGHRVGNLDFFQDIARSESCCPNASHRMGDLHMFQLTAGLKHGPPQAVY